MFAATTLSIRASADFGALTTGAAGTQIRGSEYDGRIPLVGPPRPTSGPVPSSAGAVGVADGCTGGSVDGTSDGATIGGAGFEFGVIGRPFPPLFPGVVTSDLCGSARKLIRSGSTDCSLLGNSDVNGYGIRMTRISAAPRSTWRAREAAAGPERRRLFWSSSRLGYGRRLAFVPGFASLEDAFSSPPGYHAGQQRPAGMGYSPR
jgi:hypothetical protein